MEPTGSMLLAWKKILSFDIFDGLTFTNCKHRVYSVAAYYEKGSVELLHLCFSQKKSFDLIRNF